MEYLFRIIYFVDLIHHPGLKKMRFGDRIDPHLQANEDKTYYICSKS